MRKLNVLLGRVPGWSCSRSRAPGPRLTATERHSRTRSRSRSAHGLPLPLWPSAPAYLAGPELTLRGLQAPLQGSHLVQGSPALPLAAPHTLLLLCQLCLCPAQPAVHTSPGCGPPAPSGLARPPDAWPARPPTHHRALRGLPVWTHGVELTREGAPKETGPQLRSGGQGWDAGVVRANPTGPTVAAKSRESRAKTQGWTLTFFTLGHSLLQLPHP